nr:hypothetical protein [Tanacetum cinerariifolium]
MRSWAEYINLLSRSCPAFYDNDDDDDEESSTPLRDTISELPLSVAITPDFSITDSPIMEDKHLDTIPEMESDEEYESSVEDLNLTPSESENLFKDLSDIESECDVPVYDDFMTFFNLLFDSYDDSTSSDDESFFDEDVLKENFKKNLNPLSDEEIISTKIDLHHFNAEGRIRLVEKLLYDNSSPRPLKEFNSENSDAVIESFSPSPIPVEGSNSLLEEIDIFLAPSDSMPPGIENDDYDSEGDILYLEEFLSNDSPSFPKNESFHFDVPTSSRPPTKPPDDGIYFEPNTGLLTANVVGDISKHYVRMPRFFPTQPTLCPGIDTLLSFLSENEDKVHLLSHRGFKAFQLISESPMMIYGGNIPIMDVLFLHFYPP